MKRRLSCVAILILVIIVSVVVWQNYQKSEAFKKGPSSQEILDTIAHDRPELFHDGKPIMEIVSFHRTEDTWYVVTIKSPNDKDMKVPVRLVLQDQGSSRRSLKTILGPEVDFPDYLTNTINLPDSVIIELRKS